MKLRTLVFIASLVFVSASAIAQEAGVPTLNCLNEDGYIGVEAEPFNGQATVIDGYNLKTATWVEDDFVQFTTVSELFAERPQDRFFSMTAVLVKSAVDKTMLVSVVSKGPVSARKTPMGVSASFNATLSAVQPGGKDLSERMKLTSVRCEYKRTL